MQNQAITLRPEFKRQATKAIFSILLFAITYLLILLLAAGLTVLCVMGGIWLIAAKPMFITIALGIGLASLGFFILIFLVKFMFASHKADRSHLYEITRAEEPALFALIDETAEQVGTYKPKKVYLSSDINAAVFYDSSFWSMIFPVKKNLQIGLGLVNSVTAMELKAILAHEFGHFSQRSMKLGSYVYNVNQVIFNMLYENESYDKLIQGWANISSYFVMFARLAVNIIEGIQYVLKKMYAIVNKSYMSLSREMEFHADEIATRITGHGPLKDSLLRIGLAEHSFNQVLRFYDAKVKENIKTENLYRNQADVLGFLAEINRYSFRHSLPQISLQEQSKFDKSKLVIKNQWASHPSTAERIERMEALHVPPMEDSGVLANSLFTDIEATQQKITGNIFNAVQYEGETSCIAYEAFTETYRNDILAEALPEIYNGYYDNKNPAVFDISEALSTEYSQPAQNVSELYDEEKVDLVYTAIALQGDIDTVKNIASKAYDIKTFDYDGVKYKQAESADLLPRMEQTLQQIQEQIKQNDIRIFRYFKQIEAAQNKPAAIENMYRAFFELDQVFDAKLAFYQELSAELQFVSVTTPVAQITSNLSEKVRPLEEKLKNDLREILSDTSKENTERLEEFKESFDKYLSQDWGYFDGTNYNDDTLQILYAAMNNYAAWYSRKYFSLKKTILRYQETLAKGEPVAD